MSLRRCATALKSTCRIKLFPAILISRVHHGAFPHPSTTVGYHSRTPSLARVMGRRYLSLTREEITATLETNRNRFLDAISRKDTDDICFYYGALQSLIFELPTLLPGGCDKRFYKLELEDLINATELLIQPGTTRCAGVSLMMLNDCEFLQGLKVNSDLLKHVLQALLASSQPQRAYRLILRFHRSKDSVKPNSHLWALVMLGLGEAGDIGLLKSCIDTLKSSWPFLNSEHYRILLSALLRKRRHPVAELSSVLSDMSSHVPYDPDTYELLRSATTNLGESCEILAEEYLTWCKGRTKSLTKSGVTLTVNDISGIRKRGKHAFRERLGYMKRRGFVPDRKMLSKVLSLDGVSSIKELDFLAEALEVTPDVVDWAVVIRNAAAKHGAITAVDIYEESKRRKITPNSVMIHPLLRALCDTSLKEPKELDIDRALQIYEDVREAAINKGQAYNPNITVFNTLLRVLSCSSSRAKYFPAAISLFEDLDRFDAKWDKMTASAIAVLLMRAASNSEEAMQAYRLVRNSGKQIFDTIAYASILNAYCDLGLEDLKTLPIEGCLEIINNMQEDGVPRTTVIYCVLIRRLATLATRIMKSEVIVAREELLLRLGRVIRRLHHMMSVDASVTPDIIVWNHLLDAYNRVGLFDGVMQIWTIIHSSGETHNASVSIILDACGFAGAYEQASQIWTSLKTSGYPLNAKNWHSWLECLCRLGRLDEAITTFCLDMPKEGSGATLDVMSVMILLSFARKMKRETDLRHRLEVYLPDFCKTLPEDIWD